MTQSCLLQVNHLSITIQQYSQGLRRRTLHPVQDLCLTVHPGEMLALVGASGSGKSLLVLRKADCTDTHREAEKILLRQM